MSIDAKTRRRLRQGVELVLVTLIAVVILLPIVWIWLAAFKRPVDVYQLKLWFEPTLENFRIIWGGQFDIKTKLINSTLIALATVLITIPLATLAAYAFSRFRMIGGRFLLVMILSTQFVPAVVIVLPFFVFYRDLGLLDSRIGLILIYLSLLMPFAVWMIKGFIDGIPLDTEEAALVDGSSRLQVIKNIVLPMAMPGIVTAAIFCFILAWNEFIFAIILTTKYAQTMPVGLALFNTEEGTRWELLSAAGLIIMIPIFILALIIQRHFVRGMTMGAVR
jgi:multiple sugar transport system permease protein